MESFYVLLLLLLLQLPLPPGIIQSYFFAILVQVGVLGGNGLYSPHVWGNVLQGLLLSIESPFLYLLVAKAYPAEELTYFEDWEQQQKEEGGGVVGSSGSGVDYSRRALVVGGVSTEMTVINVEKEQEVVEEERKEQGVGGKV